MPNKTNESEWKKKFDDYFPQLIKDYPKTVETVKHFISNQLSLQATRIQQENKEICICAAIEMKDGYIIRGHRHSDCIRTASQIPKYKEERPSGRNQGFVTSKGRYVDRLEGARLQKEAGIKSIMSECQEYLYGELYSEDLY